MRLPILMWSVVLALASMIGLERYVCKSPPFSEVVFTENVAMRLSVIFYLLMVGGAVLARTQAIGKADGAEPRITAIIGTFLVTVVVLFPRRELTPTESFISTFLIFVGSAFAASVLVRLGDSFSIMPEARRLVTSGPYRFIRHPLYLAEEIAVVGSLIQYLSAWTAGLVVIQLAFQLRRIRNEERFLTGTFPEYTRYKNITSRLVPKIY
jgi:protein-S-isoprenylcysteine O-methyltransferase Ste14